MEKSTKNKALAIGAFTLVGVVGVILWRLLRNPTRGINQSTVDFTHSKQQAANLFGWFGVVRVNGIAIATPTFKEATLKKIAYLAVNIDDWQVVQETFTQMCGGNYTVLEAAKTALSASNYGTFTAYISNALTKKRIICASEVGHTFRNGADRYGGILAEQFVKDDFVGRCQNTDDYYYYYISEKDGNTYCAPKTDFKLI